MEFIVDGRTVTELSGIDVDPEHITVFDLVEAGLAADVLMGRAQLTESFPPEGRLPLLVCPCGEPREGALTVRVSLTKDTVTWDRWAWEEDGFPKEPFPTLPACHFPLDEYSAAIDEAAQVATAMRGKASSIIRVADHPGGMRHRIVRRARSELAAQVDWLDLEILKPDAGGASAGLHELLAAVKSIRNELAAATTDRRYSPTLEQSERVVGAASRILTSPENFRLPQPTLNALDWLRGNLSVTK
ncbi:hypothetical protein [Arthrobacter sp. ERGS1:01]|uniref:hypothetical protein n=1 Tax=Arthrobacter sp. ERGS1:01 TaxID=1704044 RepID=UPI001237858A|nr:hypothetical protein [Arthrobacter sp. ERGS1:01]